MNGLHLGRLLAAFLKARPRLEAVAQARTGCRATAEDLIQDTWLRVENASRDSPIENPGGFITRVATHAVSDHVRKERRRAEIDAELSELLWDGGDDFSPERILIERQRLMAVRDALHELPEKTRRIFLMNRIERIPHRRIAQTLGISEQAVYYHVRRALECLATLRDEFTD